MNRWLRHPLGWYRADDAFAYRGDFRIRLQSCMWQWHGLADRRWHIWFRKADVTGGSVHRSFTLALLGAIFDTYRNYWRRGCA